VRTRHEDAAAASAAASAVKDVPVARSRDRLRGLRQACRQVFGIPDYERYLEHAAAHHPGQPVLSRSEFFNRSIDRKYGKSGPRCC
jgi:uncharacterized short protein YbdD (DUF466 family)